LQHHLKLYARSRAMHVTKKIDALRCTMMNLDKGMDTDNSNWH
jgi:hypothetical protein